MLFAKENVVKEKTNVIREKRKILQIIIFLCTSIFISVSCTSLTRLLPPASATDSGPRTLILDGKEIDEKDAGGFISWYCVDYVDEGPILLEVGFFGDEKKKIQGFILFDGGYSGKLTSYRRDGLDHRWDWSNGNYTFVIQPDGTGLYYDFSSVKPGTSMKARSVYKAYKR